MWSKHVNFTHNNYYMYNKALCGSNTIVGFCDPYPIIHGSKNMHKNKIFDHKNPKPNI